MIHSLLMCFQIQSQMQTPSILIGINAITNYMSLVIQHINKIVTLICFFNVCESTPVCLAPGEEPKGTTCTKNFAFTVAGQTMGQDLLLVAGCADKTPLCQLPQEGFSVSLQINISRDIINNWQSLRRFKSKQLLSLNLGYGRRKVFLIKAGMRL